MSIKTRLSLCLEATCAGSPRTAKTVGSRRLARASLMPNILEWRAVQNEWHPQLSKTIAAEGRTPLEESTACVGNANFPWKQDKSQWTLDDLAYSVPREPHVWLIWPFRGCHQSGPRKEEHSPYSAKSYDWQIGGVNLYSAANDLDEKENSVVIGIN